jgi:hypothetical protein
LKFIFFAAGLSYIACGVMKTILQQICDKLKRPHSRSFAASDRHAGKLQQTAALVDT